VRPDGDDTQGAPQDVEVREEAVPGPPPDGPAAEGTDGGAPAPSPEDLARAERERDEYLDALLRMKADFENYRKRTERDRVQQQARATREVVRGLLPVLDNLERAVAALAAQEESLAGGVDMVRVQLQQVLGGQGLVEIEALGRAFDPTEHEALTVQPSEEPEGTVLTVVEKGYWMADEVVRPAKVVVATAVTATHADAAGA